MRLTSLVLLSSALLALASCHRDLQKLPGKWEAAEQTPVNVPAPCTASAYIGMEFATPVTGDTPGGDVTLTARLDVQNATSTTLDTAGLVNYALNVAGTASIKGTWTQNGDDELLLTLDPTTMTVTIDPDGVAYNGPRDCDGARARRLSG